MFDFCINRARFSGNLHISSSFVTLKGWICHPRFELAFSTRKKNHINNISGEIRIAIDQTYLVIIYVRSPFGSLISESHVNYGQLETSHSAVTWEMFNPQSPTCLCNWSIAMWCHVYSMWLRSSWEKDGKVNYEI